MVDIRVKTEAKARTGARVVIQVRSGVRAQKKSKRQNWESYYS